MKITVTEEMREAISRMRQRDAEARDTQRTEGERRRNLTLVWWRDRVIPRGQVFRMRPEELVAQVERGGLSVEVRDEG